MGEGKTQGWAGGGEKLAIPSFTAAGNWPKEA